MHSSSVSLYKLENINQHNKKNNYFELNNNRINHNNINLLSNISNINTPDDLNHKLEMGTFGSLSGEDPKKEIIKIIFQIIIAIIMTLIHKD